MQTTSRGLPRFKFIKRLFRKEVTIAKEACDLTNFNPKGTFVEGAKSVTYTNCKFGDKIVNERVFLKPNEYDNSISKCECGKDPLLTLRFGGADVSCSCGVTLTGDGLTVDEVGDLWNTNHNSITPE